MKNRITSSIQYIKSNLLEIYTLLFIELGLPTIALLYGNLKLATAVFIVINVTLGVIAIRKAE